MLSESQMSKFMEQLDELKISAMRMLRAIETIDRDFRLELSKQWKQEESNAKESVE